MATVIGIDEAGYGPSLGPLVVSSAAFRADDDGAGLWRELGRAVARRPGGTRGRLLVADSKIVYAQRDGLEQLERTVLTFLGCAGPRPAGLRALIDALCDRPDEARNVAWWDDVALPAATSPEVLDTSAELLDGAGGPGRFLGLASQILPAGAFNRGIDRYGNKAVLLFQQNMALIRRALRRHDGDLTFVIDKHGGRHYYEQLLANNFFGRPLHELRASPKRSSYRVDLPERRVWFHFIAKADATRFPPALASITSKYVRELFMMCFNAHWCGRVRDLKPTAGYAADGKRFIADILPFLSDGEARDVIRRR
ncbi:MAG: hypothetical protein ACOC70_01235 [bacterium]